MRHFFLGFMVWFGAFGLLFLQNNHDSEGKIATPPTGGYFFLQTVWPCVVEGFFFGGDTVYIGLSPLPVIVEMKVYRDSLLKM